MRLLDIFRKSKGPASIFDVAKYILKHKKIRRQHITSHKTRILLYYCYVWHLKWENEKLFADIPKAGNNGINFDALDHLYDYQLFHATVKEEGDIRKLNTKQIESIDVIIDYYGRRSWQWLHDLVIQEKPWKIASEKRIADILILNYYPQN